MFRTHVHAGAIVLDIALAELLFFPSSCETDSMQNLLLRLIWQWRSHHMVVCTIGRLHSRATSKLSQARPERGAHASGLRGKCKGEDMTPSSLNKYRNLERRISPGSSLRKRLSVERPENHGVPAGTGRATAPAHGIGVGRRRRCRCRLRET